LAADLAGIQELADVLASPLMIVLLLGMCATQDDIAEKEIQPLEGKWQLLSLVHDGEVFTIKEPKNVLPFSRSQITESGYKDISKYKLDPRENPKEIDWIGIEGRHKGVKITGIYSLEGDTLKICHSHYSQKRSADGIPKHARIRA
jgi:uncharacterized protein (TIGR03067 family)